jgi:N-acetylmuramic acid-specific PTS system IIC component
MPTQLDTVVTPFLSTLIMLFINLFLIIPISGYLFFAVSVAFKVLSTGPGAPFGDMVLAGIFLLAVMFGIHQGFVPIYIALVKEIGINTLFPVLGMAGASMFGTGLAFLFIAKKGGLFQKQIAGAMIPGFLGIAEPMIYGIALPRVIPFVTACIGAMIPGFFIGAMNA